MIESLKSHITLPADKSVAVYVILALFLGGFGVHNFWAGNNEKAKAELIVGVLSVVTCGLLSPISLIVTIIDIIDALKK